MSRRRGSRRQLLKTRAAGLDYVFFSDSGSTCVEVALKMALGYWRNIGERRTRIVVMQHAYHGDTVGAMSVGARGVFNAAYEPLLFDVGRDSVSGGRPRTSDARCARSCMPRAEIAAAFIVEPLILGAGGMLMYPAWVLKEMKRICEAARRPVHCRRSDDGLGPHRNLFACEQADVSPDIACYSKGLTGGSLPLAVTLCRGRDFRRALFARPQPHLLSFEFLYGQPDCLRGRQGQPRIYGMTRLSQRAWPRSRQCRRMRSRPLRADEQFKNVRRDRHHHGA